MVSTHTLKGVYQIKFEQIYVFQHDYYVFQHKGISDIVHVSNKSMICFRCAYSFPKCIIKYRYQKLNNKE